MKFTVREAGESNIVVEIFAPATNASPIQDLFYKFDIPGRFITAELEGKDKIESCAIYDSHLARIGTDSGMQIIAQTVHVDCKSIVPGGFVRVRTTLSPTRLMNVPGSRAAGYTNMFTMPLMDLRDYTRCLALQRGC